MHSFDISIENLSKIEGHANLDVKVREGKVEKVKLKIMENQRFYEQAVRGHSIITAPQLMSRICGTCSIAHLTCCIEAVENAINFQPSDQTMLLRKLSMYGLMIRDHALHLYFFMMPDVIGKDSILDFDENNEKEHKIIHDALDIKGAGNNLSNLVAGRSVHAPFPTVGGFLHIPNKEETNKCVAQLKSIRPLVLDCINIFHYWPQRFERETDFVGLRTKDFSFLDGEITSSRGICIQEKEYLDHLIKIIIPYSQSSGFEFEGQEFMVGALARMNLNKESLHRDTREDAKQYLSVFPSGNIFHNNMAQAIEVLHCVDHSIELLENTEFKPEKQEIKAKAGIGVGVVEAPRGTLYYKVNVNSGGNISNATVIVPTAQNQINIEKDIGKLVADNIEKPKQIIEHEIEKLIRAYDPCMSCASHFLKVNWL